MGRGVGLFFRRVWVVGGGFVTGIGVYSVYSRSLIKIVYFFFIIIERFSVREGE